MNKTEVFKNRNAVDPLFPEKSEEPLPKPKIGDEEKRVFSCRAVSKDIVAWKAYAVATKQPTGALIAAAVREYMANHTLTDEQRTVYDFYAK